MSRIELVAVDLDGTLVDSAPDLAFCVDHALASLQLAPAGEALTRTWIGDGIEALLERALVHATGREPEAGLRRTALESFSACYRRSLFIRSRLYPGVPETLATLAERGIKLACITNKRVGFAERLLEEAEIRDYFDVVLGGDSLAAKKPSPLQLSTAARTCAAVPERSAMVGDSPHDYRAARAAGYRFFWAVYGYCRSIEEHADSPITPLERFAAITEHLQ